VNAVDPLSWIPVAEVFFEVAKGMFAVQKVDPPGDTLVEIMT